MHHIYWTSVSMSYFLNSDIEESTVQVTVTCRIERILLLYRGVIMNSQLFCSQSRLFEKKIYYYTVILKDGFFQLDLSQSCFV